MEKIKILVVEDDLLVADHLQDTLINIGYEIVGLFPTGEKAILKAKETKPDLILMDIVLKGEMDGIKTAEQISAHSDIPIVYLTAYSDRDTLDRAIATDPFGYILKPFKEKDLYITLRMALHKHQLEKKAKDQIQSVDAYLSKKVEDLLEEYHSRSRSPSLSSSNLLTSRETEILQFITNGQSTKGIANQLHLSVRTVESHRQNIMQKLDVHDIASLIRFALKHKLVSTD